MDNPVVPNVDDLGDGNSRAPTGKHIGARHDLLRIDGLVGNVHGRPVSSWVFQSTSMSIL